MTKVGIIGLGLIGTSLGLALKRAGLPNLEIVGTDKERGQASKAQKARAVDRTAGRLVEAAEDADLVIIATPVRAIADIMENISHRLKEGCVVTDTADTKGVVLELAEQHLPRHVSFVGGHPMLGGNSDQTGGPRANLFQDRPYCILPGKGASESDVKELTDIIRMIGAKPYYMDVTEHDSFVAAVNHLPVLLSVALLGCTSKSPSWDDIAKIASSQYNTATELGASSVTGEDILLSNNDSMVHWIDAFIQELYAIRRIISDGADDRQAALDKAFSDAFEARSRWLADVVTPESVARAAAKRERLPTAGEGLTSLFVGERQARRLLDLGRRDKESKK